ncbi:MAG: alpha/beta fold hydrolase [Caulobacterales bacterium]
MTRRTLLCAGIVCVEAAMAQTAPPPPEAWTLTLPGFNNAAIAYRSIGVGRPVLMLHGLLSSASNNWIAPGIAERIAGLGRRVVLPDFRAHGRSSAPTSASDYPQDVLARDTQAVIAELDLQEFDLVGYSMGAQIAVRLLASGARPGRVALGGMGYSGIVQGAPRRALFEDAILNGEAAADPRLGRIVQNAVARSHIDPLAVLGVLRSQVDTPSEVLATLSLPTLIVSGDQDQDNGSAEDLAVALPNAQVVRVPGDHLSAVSDPAFAAALVAFLAADGN